MNIALVSCSESLVNPFSSVEKLLAKSIADAEFSEFIAPNLLDVPKAAGLAAKDAELVIVFVLLERADFRQEIVLEKLVDAELASKARIVKIVESLDESEEEEDEKAIAKRIKNHVLALLFPKESEETMEETGSESSAAGEEGFEGEESGEEAAEETPEEGLAGEEQ